MGLLECAERKRADIISSCVRHVCPYASGPVPIFEQFARVVDRYVADFQRPEKKQWRSGWPKSDG